MDSPVTPLPQDNFSSYTSTPTGSCSFKFQRTPILATLSPVPEEGGSTLIAMLNSTELDIDFSSFASCLFLSRITFIYGDSRFKKVSLITVPFQIGLGNYPIAGCQEPVIIPITPITIPHSSFIDLFARFLYDHTEAIAKSGQTDIEASHAGLANTICHIYILTLISSSVNKMNPLPPISCNFGNPGGTQVLSVSSTISLTPGTQ